MVSGAEAKVISCRARWRSSCSGPPGTPTARSPVPGWSQGGPRLGCPGPARPRPFPAMAARRRRRIWLLKSRRLSRDSTSRRLACKKMKTKRRTRRSRRFFYSQKDSKGPFSSGLSFFFKSPRVGGLNLSLTRNNEVHCSQFFYFDCFYIVCLFALWACFSVFFSKQELLLSPLELFMQQRNTFETAQIFNTTLFNMFRRLSWNGPNFFKASSLITTWQQMSSSFIQALLSKFRTEPIKLL